VIEEVLTERENYSKVILHKPMMLPKKDQKSEKEIDIRDSSSNTRGSPGLVKRRVLEMSQQSSLNRKGSRNSPSSPRRSSPNFGRRGPNPPKKSTNLLAPKPFAKPSEGSKNVQKPEFYMKFTSPKKNSSLPQQSPTKKPAVPPKPRNVVVSRRKSQKIEDDPNEQNDSGLSEEADDVFNESVPMRNCSFASLSQKIDDQRFDLLKRRQSYSEFEDLIEKKRELRERMLSKIMLLREERDLLMEEKIENDHKGKKIAQKLETVAKSTELDKFRLFLEEIEQITKLTVSLTIRLSRLSKRIENGTSHKEEKTMQLKKKSKLVDQLNEAEILHQNTDRRASQVRSLLGKYLDEPDLREYDTFLVHLIKHITDLKETEQRIKLGEEQLVALNDNLITPPSPS